MNDKPLFYVHLFAKGTYFEKTLEDIKVVLSGLNLTRSGSDNENYYFVYKDSNFDYYAKFIKTSTSLISNINTIDPAYHSLNFHLEFDLSTPNFFAKRFLQIVEYLSSKIELYVYSEVLTQVIKCDVDVLLNGFTLAKKNYFEHYPSLKNKYYVINTNKLTQTITYLLDKAVILNHYGKIQAFSQPRFYVDKNLNVVIIVDYDFANPVIFPPYIDYIRYVNKQKTYLIKYSIFKEKNIKLGNLSNVLGTKESLLVVPKRLAKVNKVLLKNKDIVILDELKEISIYNLID